MRAALYRDIAIRIPAAIVVAGARSEIRDANVRATALVGAAALCAATNAGIRACAVDRGVYDRAIGGGVIAGSATITSDAKSCRALVILVALKPRTRAAIAADSEQVQACKGQRRRKFGHAIYCHGRYLFSRHQLRKNTRRIALMYVLNRHYYRGWLWWRIRFVVTILQTPAMPSLMIAFLSFVAFGLVVGLVARAVMPGNQPLGWLMTAVLGIAGSFVGSFLAQLLHLQSSGGGFVGSTIGALLLLFIANKVNAKR